MCFLLIQSNIQTGSASPETVTENTDRFAGILGAVQ